MWTGWITIACTPDAPLPRHRKHPQNTHTSPRHSHSLTPTHRRTKGSARHMLSQTHVHYTEHGTGTIAAPGSHHTHTDVREDSPRTLTPPPTQRLHLLPPHTVHPQVGQHPQALTHSHSLTHTRTRTRAPGGIRDPGAVCKRGLEEVERDGSETQLVERPVTHPPLTKAKFTRGVPQPLTARSSAGGGESSRTGTR